MQDQKIVDLNLSWQEKFKSEGRFNHQERAEHKLPSSLSKVLSICDKPLDLFRETLELKSLVSFDLKDHRLNCPLDKITSYRDFYAHEKHVKKGFEKRGEEIPEAWHEMPVYYKGSTVGFIGEQEEILWPSYSEVLDFELEMGMVILKEGKNIKEEMAMDHILGLTILNDISARDIQKKEMSVRLGPAKGKDFCSVMGPVIVTMDEFNNKEPNLLMQAFINGEKWSEGHSGDSKFNFSQMIAHASYDEWLLPGDFFGSGTVGTGCGLELDKWIKPGDEIELKVESIGSLKNIVGQK